MTVTRVLTAVVMAPVVVVSDVIDRLFPPKARRRHRDCGVCHGSGLVQRDGAIPAGPCPGEPA